MARPKNNNNPFAIMDTTPDPWKGLKGRTQDGFLIFDTPANGVRAGFINLINAYLKRGLNTIEKIFPVYAPAGHGANVPEDYIKNVVRITGIPRDKIISSDGDLYKIGKAIVTHEEGNFWVLQADFNHGFNEAISKADFLTQTLFGGGAALVIILLLLFLL